MWASQLHWFLKEHLDDDRIRSKYVGVVINKFLIYITKYFVLTAITFVLDRTKLWNIARKFSSIFRLRELLVACMLIRTYVCCQCLSHTSVALLSLSALSVSAVTCRCHIALSVTLL
jgi:hypothetical protein